MFYDSEPWDYEESTATGDFNCWSCRKPVTFQSRLDNDGFCPHCNVEIELDEGED